MASPADDLLRISMSHGLPRSLHAVAELGIADALGEAPRSAEELAADTSTHAGALARTLRVLSAEGIFEARTDGKWGHTAASRLLRSDHPQSMRSFVRTMGLPVYWRGFEYFTDALTTGQSTQEKVVPGGYWKYLSENPAAARLFDEAMTAKARGQIAGVVGSYDFSAFQTIADIGGGRGHLLTAVLQAAPLARGVLFDLPHVTAAARAAGTGSDRLRVQPGDFFVDALPAADCYLIMQVIHDWDDAKAARILAAVRKAAAAGAKLLLIECIVPEDSKPSWTKMLDLQMLTLLSGKERTENEYSEMLRTAGFRLDRAVDVGMSTSILESVAV
jgi:O-methyltransferase domain